MFSVLPRSAYCFTYLLVPVLVAAGIFTVTNIYFNNYILPEANHRASNLYSDISHKKPAVMLEPGILIRNFTNYALWVKRVNAATGVMKDVRIFSAVPGEDPSTTIAESGTVALTPDEKQIALTLYNGETHRQSIKNTEEYSSARLKNRWRFLPIPTPT